MMRRSQWSPGLVCAVLFLSGCVAIPSRPISASTEGVESAADPVVIALLDTGADPYSEVYRVADDSWALAAVDADVQSVDFSPPDEFSDPVYRDEAKWAALEPNILYHFANTRLFAISVDGPDREFDYVRDAHLHGAGTSYLAAREAPDSVIVMIQVGVGLCGAEQPSCLFSPTIAEGMQWAADQEWIDVISVSLGIPGNLPDQDIVHGEAQLYREASELAAQRGKLIINGAGNDPSLTLGDYFNGPPWIITVGGFEPHQQGEQIFSAHGLDVVANMTEFVPRTSMTEKEWTTGTSLATPIVAGTLGNALGRIRLADPTRHVTAEELRDALNASAVYVDATDWNPTPAGREPLPEDLYDSASLPILAQPQMGWGYLNGSLAPEIARRVLERDFTIPAEKDQAMIFQPAWQQAREEYWAKMRAS